MSQSKQTIYARDIQLLQSKLKIDESKASYKKYLFLFIILGIGYNLTDMYHTERTTRKSSHYVTFKYVTYWVTQFKDVIT